MAQDDVGWYAIYESDDYGEALNTMSVRLIDGWRNDRKIW